MRSFVTSLESDITSIFTFYFFERYKMRLLATDGAGSGFVEKAKPGCGAIY